MTRTWDPVLQFDVGRAQVEKVIDDALASGDERSCGPPWSSSSARLRLI